MEFRGEKACWLNGSCSDVQERGNPMHSYCASGVWVSPEVINGDMKALAYNHGVCTFYSRKLS